MNDHPRQIAKDVWAIGGAYEIFMGRWSRLVALEFLRWLSVPPGKSWLDVGCGTGVLSRAILDSANPARVRGVDQAPGFISFAKNQVHDIRVTFDVTSVELLKSDPGSYDAVVSGLALNFFPDPNRAVSDMMRVASPGGVVAAYVWDYAGGMELLRRFWEAAVSMDSNASELDEGNRFPICSSRALTDLFVARCLRNVDVRAIDVIAHFSDFQDYWKPFLSGQGPAPGYMASLTVERQNQLRELLRSSLPSSPGGVIDLPVRAWAVRGYSQRYNVQDS